MNDRVYELIAVDGPPLLAAVLAALSCGLLGNFLVLRKLSLMGDAISHAVLPGLVLAFIITSSRHFWPTLIGAGVAGVTTVVLVELIKRHARVEPGAAMGVVFSILFALGVLLLERVAARTVDLDADCVLYGQLEALFWFPPTEWASFFDRATLAEMPRQIWTLAAVFILVVIFIGALFKELRIAAFDAQLATALGINAGALHMALMVFVAAATVAAFEAVGSILVIAMLICPAATARLLTDRLKVQIALSAVAALLAAIGGYVLAGFGPGWLGFDHSVNAAGMISVTGGAVLGITAVVSPSHGILARRRRLRTLAITVAREDAIAALYRIEEIGNGKSATLDQLAQAIGGTGPARKAIAMAMADGEVTLDARQQASLTERGRARARTIVRSHRLWEAYLVSELGLRPDHVHDIATRLEHLRRPETGTRLEPDAEGRTTDPHDKPIPDADE